MIIPREEPGPNRSLTWCVCSVSHRIQYAVLATDLGSTHRNGTAVDELQHIPTSTGELTREHLFSGRYRVNKPLRSGPRSTRLAGPAALRGLCWGSCNRSRQGAGDEEIRRLLDDLRVLPLLVEDVNGAIRCTPS